jgi:hypothetical protein
VNEFDENVSLLVCKSLEKSLPPFDSDLSVRRSDSIDRTDVWRPNDQTRVCSNDDVVLVVNAFTTQ